MNPIRLYTLALGTAGAVLAAYLLLHRKPKNSDDLERERRGFLVQVGRITDGTVIDVQQINGNDDRFQTLLIYHYDVAGVSYEASQDITSLRQFVDIHTCRVGLPSSVKYDPQNPGDSIVIAEDWSGLRTEPIRSGILRRQMEAQQKR